MSEKHITYVAQVRRKHDGTYGVWFDEQYLPDGGESGKAKVEALRKDPQLADYQVRAVRRTEEVLDL